MIETIGDRGGASPRGRRFVSSVIMAAITARIVAVMLQTVPSYDNAGQILQTVIDYSSILFIIEYMIRIWIESTTSAEAGSLQNVFKYILSFKGIIDLVVFMPFVAERFFTIHPDYMIIPESMAVLKLTRYAHGLNILFNVFRREARALWAALITLIVALVLTSALMYVLEHHAQPTVFDSLPSTMWWGITTMSTVGYGDMVPATSAGKFVGGIFMLLGIAMFAVPAGLLASGFSEELKNNEFIVTWQTVAQVPLFRKFDAETIARIAQLLEPRRVSANSVVVRRNDRATALYFVMSGEVETEANTDLRFKDGDFFGEVALLRDIRYESTVIAVRETRLLVLGVADFRRLIEDTPAIQVALEAGTSAV